MRYVLNLSNPNYEFLFGDDNSSDGTNEKIDQLRKDLFDLRFKQATRQLNETHQFKIIKKQVAQLLTISKSQSTSQKSAD